MHLIFCGPVPGPVCEDASCAAAMQGGGIENRLPTVGQTCMISFSFWTSSASISVIV